jgi:hypothetical protein
MADLTSEIAQLFFDYRGFLPNAFRWESEKDRWHELVFCLYSALSEQNFETSRRVVSNLANLHLLEADDLASAITKKGTLDPEHSRATTLLEILKENGIDRRVAERIVLSICEAARGIHAKHGHLQKLFWRHAQAMLTDLGSVIALSDVSKDVERRALSMWLQNVFEMPLSRSETAVEAFCMQKNCTSEELADAADQVGIHHAVLDDLIHLHALGQAVGSEHGEDR